MLTEKEYLELKKQHEEACKVQDYSKMIMIGDENHKKLRAYEQLHCKHLSVAESQGGQVERCLVCGKILT
jgi:hypothetical protein